jgi:hypothetical protein
MIYKCKLKDRSAEKPRNLQKAGWEAAAEVPELPRVKEEDWILHRYTVGTINTTYSIPTSFGQ